MTVSGRLSLVVAVILLALTGGAPTALAQTSGFLALEKLAKAGDPKAMYRLGARYFNGEGAPKNETEGMRWYVKAAELGEPQAAANVGVGYLLGVHGLPQDNAQALRWLKIGAEGKAANAGMALSQMYEKGSGVPVDLAEAAR